MKTNRRSEDPMNDSTPAIQIDDLTYAYGRAEAVRNLNLTVRPGRCYGLFGRNGAGKTTTMKCLLNLLRPQSGQARVFGLDPAKHEVEVKRRLAYVPDQVAFYPWMTIRETLDYLASFRDNWNRKTEQELLGRFRLDPAKRTGGLSKGQRTQVALIAAVCPETDLLVLDEPTSGLDPIVRREFIETVIGAYQEGNPGQRTIFVSTHLITEFEGLIDEFTIVDGGRAVLTLASDDARARYQRIRARYALSVPEVDLKDALRIRLNGREVEVIANGAAGAIEQRLRQLNPEHMTTESLTLEEVFVATLKA
jgi:ABC-2 type transport system ATP-binding protein